MLQIDTTAHDIFIHTTDFEFRSPTPKRLGMVAKVLDDLVVRGDFDTEVTPIDLATLCKVCLTCGSVASTHDQANRDRLVEWVDLTCCNPDTTVLFHTKGMFTNLTDPATAQIDTDTFQPED